MDRIVASVQGVEEVLVRMSRLDKSVQKKYLGSSVREVVKEAVPEVKALTPKGPTGNLRRSVGMKLEKKKTTTAVGLVGYRARPGGNNSEKGFHAWWIENGVRDRYPNKVALKVPMDRAKKYSYLKGSVALVGGDGGGAIFFRSVRGFVGPGKFEEWANANLDKLKRKLVGKLENNVGKAIAEQERRDIRRIHGGRR
jgi:hypothetical protein